MDDARYFELLRRKVDLIERNKPGLERLGPLNPPEVEPRFSEPNAPRSGRSETAVLEAIIRWNRPVLAVVDDKFVAQTGDDPNAAASDALIKALNDARAGVDAAIRSVGRIELRNNLDYPWCGTGWVVGSQLDEDIIVTNEHVARVFAARSGDKFVFRPGAPDYLSLQSATIDFREELSNAAAREFPVTEIVWISDDPGLDMAILRVARTAGADRIDPPIALQEGISPGGVLAVIGYPGSGGGYDPEPFRKLFGPVLGRKRLSPGFDMGPRGRSTTHDCSTLPGSSGSVVLDVGTGKAIGLHFAGTAFETNYAAPASEIAQVFASRPWQPRIGARAPLGGTERLSASPGEATVIQSGPVEIIIRIGAGAGGAAAPPVAPDEAARRVREHLRGRSEVLAVKTGLLFRDGEVSDDTGVIVLVEPGANLAHAAYGLPTTFGAVEIAVEDADPRTFVEERLGIPRELFSGRFAGYARDTTDPRFALGPVTDSMKITLHVSPEAGWWQLGEFLARDKHDQLTIGMYHVTAPHIVRALEAVVERDETHVTLTLDRQRGDADPPDDTSGRVKLKDEPEKKTLATLKRLAGKRFRWAPASLGATGLFPSAYHIKVAVWSDRADDGELTDRAVWLSSGNWQSTNQFDLGVTDEVGLRALAYDQVAQLNREWHAVVEHRGLAATFRNHLEQDFLDNSAAEHRGGAPDVEVVVPVAETEAVRRPPAWRAFAPLVIEGEITVQPLLTPDNYPDVVEALILEAKERIFVENQSFTLWTDIGATPAHFLRIAEALKQRRKAGLDVRIIFRSGFGGERDTVRKLKEFGFDTGPDRVRCFDHCHTKGIVVDEAAVVLGSQNWTAAGVGPNRDASLLIRHEKAARYFAELFLHDWEQLARPPGSSAQRAGGAVRVRPTGAEAPVPAGCRIVSLSEYLGET